MLVVWGKDVFMHHILSRSVSIFSSVGCFSICWLVCAAALWIVLLLQHEHHADAPHSRSPYKPQNAAAGSRHDLPVRVEYSNYNDEAPESPLKYVISCDQASQKVIGVWWHLYQLYRSCMLVVHSWLYKNMRNKRFEIRKGTRHWKRSSILVS